MSNVAKASSLMRAVLVGAVLVLVAGCAETKKGEGVRASGFLGDYSMLRKGGKGEAEFIYKNPTVNWTMYRSIQLDPVTYWRDSKGRYSHADMLALANAFHRLLYNKLSPDYRMVRVPTFGAMRLQVAITDVDKGEPVLDKISTVVPVGVAINALKSKPTFVGEASIEAKLTDSITGELLYAVMDRRFGGKKLGKTMNAWKDVAAVLEFYSSQAAYRLCTLRAGQNCRQPKE
jgi:hypothetical protein